MLKLETPRRELVKNGGRFLGHAIAMAAGLILMFAGLAMGVSLVLLPVGIPVGIGGLLVFLWGLFNRPEETQYGNRRS